MNMRSHVDDNAGRKRHHDSADDRGYYLDRNQRGYQIRQPSGLFSARDEFARDNGGRNYYRERCPTWQCAECKSENIDTGDGYCANCRTACEDYEYSRPRSSSTDYYNHRKHMREEERYQRHPRDDRRYENNRIVPQSSPSMGWPPLFETNGAAYVFDARSGLFYEGLSDFFFDPKTKLYFGNKQQLYYMHCPSKQPPFVAVEGDVASAAIVTEKSEESHSKLSEANPGMMGLSAGGAAEVTTKNKIAISIGKGKTFKKLAEAKESEENHPIVAASKGAVSVCSDPVIEIVPIQKKRCVADIEKWAKRQEEIRVETLPECSQLPPPSESVDSLGMSERQTVQKTADGKPICSLCKRKFASLEKLQEHEEVSTLHKQNLLRANDQLSSSVPDTKEYRDRAKERRDLFGVEPPKPKSSAVVPPSYNLEAAPSPRDNLGNSNIGNKLLQKLGWNEGSVLGRNPNNDTGENLKQDWERIEAMANSKNGARHTGKGIGGL